MMWEVPLKGVLWHCKRAKKAGWRGIRGLVLGIKREDLDEVGDICPHP